MTMRLLWRERRYEKFARDVQIILLRLDKLTFAEIGEKFGISQERVRQIVNKHRWRLVNNKWSTQ